MINEETIYVVVVIGVLIAGITEIVKFFDKENRLTSQQIEIITLMLGIILGMVGAWMTKGLFSDYIKIGLAGTFISAGVYQYAKNWLGLGGEK